MKNILITQKSECISQRDEHRDCLDQQFAAILSDSFNLIVVPNSIINPKQFAKSLNCSGIILSGGNRIWSKTGADCMKRLATEIQLLEFAQANNLPVVGICYGMQMINIYCGGKIKKVDNHVAVEHSIYFDTKKVSVNSFHEFCVPKDGLAEKVEALGSCEDDTIECFLHKELPWLGIMWHPERKMPCSSSWNSLIKKIFTQNGIITRECIKKYLNEVLSTIGSS